jgi:Family of unknown function (DUF6082)
MHGGIHRSLRTISIMALVVGGIFLILISPMGLRLISTAKGINWARLSSIGQTYGAISAVISGVALAGIAVSLFLQARELDLTREQMFRTYHLDLVRFSIENPSFISSWGYVPTEGSSLDDVRRVGYTNMIVSFWSTSYVTRRLDESELQLNFAQMFKGEVGRNYWEGSRDEWHESARDRRRKKFFNIADAEYHKAIAAGPALVSSNSWSDQESDQESRITARPGGHRRAEVIAGFAAGVVVGATVCFLRKLSSLFRRA